MGDRKAVGRLEVVDIVVEVERLFSGVLVGVVELDSEPERAVLLHRGTHEQSPLEEMGRKKKTQDQTRLSHSHLCLLVYCQFGTTFHSVTGNSIRPTVK